MGVGKVAGTTGTSRTTTGTAVADSTKEGTEDMMKLRLVTRGAGRMMADVQEVAEETGAVGDRTTVVTAGRQVARAKFPILLEGAFPILQEEVARTLQAGLVPSLQGGRHRIHMVQLRRMMIHHRRLRTVLTMLLRKEGGVSGGSLVMATMLSAMTTKTAVRETTVAMELVESRRPRSCLKGIWANTSERGVDLAKSHIEAGKTEDAVHAGPPFWSRGRRAIPGQCKDLALLALFAVRRLESL